MNVFEAPGAGVQSPKSKVQSRDTLDAGTLDIGLWTLDSHEFAGQPIEQFGMRGRFDSRAEIFRRRHQARSKISLPDTVDDHARGGRAAGIDQPPGQAEPIARRILGKWM